MGILLPAVHSVVVEESHRRKKLGTEMLLEYVKRVKALEGKIHGVNARVEASSVLRRQRTLPQGIIPLHLPSPSAFPIEGYCQRQEIT
jgi:hypothetical protein